MGNIPLSTSGGGEAQNARRRGSGESAQGARHSPGQLRVTAFLNVFLWSLFSSRNYCLVGWRGDW